MENNVLGLIAKTVISGYLSCKFFLSLTLAVGMQKITIWLVSLRYQEIW